MTDDAVRERHGVTARQSGFSSHLPINVWEEESKVVIEGHTRDADLTIWQARYLAGKLYRLARRIEKRQEEKS